MRGHGVQGRLTGEIYQMLLAEVGVDEAVERVVERWLVHRNRDAEITEEEPILSACVSQGSGAQGSLKEFDKRETGKVQREQYKEPEVLRRRVVMVTPPPKVFKVLERYWRMSRRISDSSVSTRLNNKQGV
jgi:hypothetical protein